MTADALYNAIYDWAELVINTEPGNSVPIIASHGNGPAPEDPCVVVQWAPSFQATGKSSSVWDSDDLKTYHIQDQEIDFVIWEIGGRGSYLTLLRDSLNRYDIRQTLLEKNVSFFRSGQMIQVPKANQGEWSRELRMEFIFGVTTSSGETTNITAGAEISKT